jgi:hypothetical protein
VHREQASLDVIIFFDPNCPEDELWDLYADEADVILEDPDQPKLERAWDRRVRISRFFKGSLTAWRDVEALFYGETVYGDSNHPILQKRRSVYYQKAKEYQTKLNESIALVENLMAAKNSMSSSEASQQAYKIAKILKPDPVYGPLDGLLQNPQLSAESLGKT